MENDEEKPKSKPTWGLKRATTKEENDVQKHESEKLPDGRAWA